MKNIVLLISIIFCASVSFAHNLSTRIGIIGAGPSGLVAAWELKKKGYTDVVVLEKNSHIGGKVMTVVHDGLPYEMGAVITAPDYQIVLSLAKELGVSLESTPPSICSDDKGQICSMLEWSNEEYGWMKTPRLINDFLKFSYFVINHPKFFDPGFAHTPEQMITTMEDFMRQEGMSAVLEAFRPVMVGCGYGYAESMPAPYWMKLMKTFGHEHTKYAFSSAPFYQGFTNGWQQMWQKLVEQKQLDVRLDTEVTHIDRQSSERVYVATTKGNFVFDKIIVTTPHIAHKFMVRTVKEQSVFSNVKTLSYKVTLAQIDNLPRKTHLWIRKNSHRENGPGSFNDGKPVLISSNQDSNVYQIYQFSELNRGNLALRAIMKKTLFSMGADLKDILREETFDYFPHFDVESFKNGLPQKLSDFQGENNTYYTGALFNFETVELAAQHAQSLVVEHF